METHAVTENPMIIMLINMTVVFLVLIAIGIVIELLHMIDPTKKKKDPAPVPVPAAVAPPPAAPPKVEGIPPEVIAAISAAIYAMGYSASEIRAVRPIQRNGWKAAGMSDAINAKLRV